MSKKKKLAAFAAALALLLAAAAPFAVCAEDNTTIDMSRIGSIEIVLLAGEKPIPDAEIRIYKIADIGVEGYLYVYTYTEEFADCGVDIEHLFDDTEAPVKITEYVQEKSLVGKTALTNGDGRVKFTDMGVGVYLVVNMDYLNDYMSIQPFIASVPIMSEDGTVWVYDIEAQPKLQTTESCPKKITVRKVWNDKSDAEGKRPDKVNVHLFKGEKLYAMATLSEENEWTHTWENLPIEFAWHVRETRIPEGYTVEYTKTDNYNFLITNTYDDELVKTGQNWLPVPILAVAGVLLIALGIVIRRKKKA